jgi:glycosyltransferase involved in cell wall biosynthesis
MNLPLVTIGLTCFNAEDTIGRAITSALVQDWLNIEVVIVDDFSFDGSVAIVEATIASDQRARLVSHKRNTGPAGARNTLLAEAKGEFIVFFDDDDESLPNRVSTQLKTLIDFESRSGASLVACYAGGIRRYPNGYTKDLPAIGSRGVEIPNGSGLADYLLFYRRKAGWFYGSGVPTCALMARMSTFEVVDGFDTEFKRLEDADFAIRLAFKGGHFVGTKERLFVQYATDSADKSPEKNLEGEQRLAKKNKSYLRSKSRYYYALHWPKLRYWHFNRRYGRFLLEFLGLIFCHPKAVSSHLLTTGPRRLLHEVRMYRKDKP